MITSLQIKNGELDLALAKIYGCKNDEAKNYADRILYAIDGYNKTFEPCEEFRIFSAPGRTEIGGNHTDHQLGRVLCASVNYDIIGIVVPNDSNTINIKSEGHKADIVDINSLQANEDEYGKSFSLVKGIAARFKEMGYDLHGFNAYTISNVPGGSGLSSSAAYEVLVGNMMNSLFAKGEVNPVEIAKIGQYAENVYFGKPCGLMDQMASSVGGIITVDFADKENPVIEKVAGMSEDYKLCIIDSCVDHADLTDEYADITVEMRKVANFFGKDYLRQVDPKDFYANLKVLREIAGDRAVLRGIHFFGDNDRVTAQVAALNNKDYKLFNKLVVESGHSSYMYLQNVYVTTNPQEQACSIILALCEELLREDGGYRVHGGGFAGTLQAFVPNEKVESFKTSMENLLEKDKCHVLNIRPTGGCEIIL